MVIDIFFVFIMFLNACVFKYCVVNKNYLENIFWRSSHDINIQFLLEKCNNYIINCTIYLIKPVNSQYIWRGYDWARAEYQFVLISIHSD